VTDQAAFYDRALRRIRILTFVVGATGAIAWLIAQGLQPALGFAAGAALSVLNFRGILALADVVGGTRKPGLWAAFFIALRYAVIGFAIYVIVKILKFAPAPMLLGLLAPFGAAVLEILYELIFPVHA